MIARKTRSPLFRLGEILLEAGIISPDVLDQGLIIAKRAAMPLGRVLVMSGHVSELDVECALVTQVSIRDRSIDVRMAKELLRFAHVHQVTIDEAYKLNGIGRGVGPLPRLGKLMMAAGLVDDSGLQCAVRHSKSTGYPLGRALVSLRLIDEATLSNCLNLQILLRDKRIAFLDAVRVLQSLRGSKISLEVALRNAGVNCSLGGSQPRLGDILVQAGLLAKADSLIICELGTENDVAFGDLLIKYNLATPHVVEAALEIQRMIGLKTFSKKRAYRLLELVASMEKPLERLLAEFDVLDQIVALLRAAGVIDERTMRDTAASIKDFEYTVSEVLIQRGVVTKEMSRTGLVMVQEIQRGNISYERALEILGGFKPQTQLDDYDRYCAEWERAVQANSRPMVAA